MVKKLGPDVRYVRTMEGARFYGVPIGTPIRADRAAAANRNARAAGVQPPKKALAGPTPADVVRDGPRRAAELEVPSSDARGRAEGAAVGTVLQDEDGVVAWKKTGDNTWEHEAGFTLGDADVQKFIDNGELQFEDAAEEEQQIPYAQMSREKFIGALDGKDAGHQLNVNGATWTKGEDGRWSDGERNAAPQALYFLKDGITDADAPDEDTTDETAGTLDVGDSATPDWVNSAPEGAQLTTDAGATWTKQADGSWKSERTGTVLKGDGMSRAVESQNAIISRNESAPEDDGTSLFPGAEKFDEKTLRAAVESLEAHSGFQILYGFPKGSPLRDKELVGALTTHARAQHPDLSPKKAVIAHLHNVLGDEIQAPEPDSSDPRDNEQITIGAADPKRVGVQGMNGGQFTRKDIQEAIDILEAFQGKAYKSELNKKGNALGVLDPTSIVGIYKDKSEGKRAFVDHLRSTLSDLGGDDTPTPDPDPEPAPTPDPTPEPELDSAWYDAATPGTVVEFEYFTGNVSTWTKQADGTWANDRMPNARREASQMANDLVGGRMVSEGAAPEPEPPIVRSPAQLWNESPETVEELDSLKPGTFIRYLGQYYYRHPDGQWRFANDDGFIGTDSESFRHTLRGITVVSLPQSGRARIQNVLGAQSEYLDPDADLDEEVRPGDTLVLVSADGKQFRQYRRITGDPQTGEKWLTPNGELKLTEEIESDFKEFDTADGDSSPYYRVNRLSEPIPDPGPGLFTGEGQDIPEPEPAPEPETPDEPTAPEAGTTVKGVEALEALPVGTRLIYTRKDGRQTAYNIRDVAGNKILVTDKGTEVAFDRARSMNFVVADAEGTAPVPTPEPAPTPAPPAPDAPTPEPETPDTPAVGERVSSDDINAAPVGFTIAVTRVPGQTPVLMRKRDEDGRWDTDDPSTPIITSNGIYRFVQSGDAVTADPGTFQAFETVAADDVESLPTGSVVRVNTSTYLRGEDGNWTRYGVGSSDARPDMYTAEELGNDISTAVFGGIVIQRGSRDVPAPGSVLTPGDVFNLPEGARVAIGDMPYVRTATGFQGLNSGETITDFAKFLSTPSLSSRLYRLEDIQPEFTAADAPKDGDVLTEDDLLRLPAGSKIEAVFPGNTYSGPPKTYTITERFKASNDVTGTDSIGQLISYAKADGRRQYVYRGKDEIQAVKVGSTLEYPAQFDELPTNAVLVGPRGELVRKTGDTSYAVLWKDTSATTNLTGSTILTRFGKMTYVRDSDPNAPFTPAVKGDLATDQELRSADLKAGTMVVLNVPDELGGTDASGYYSWNPATGRWVRSRTKTGSALRGAADRRPRVLNGAQMALAASDGRVKMHMVIGDPLPQPEFRARMRAATDVDEVTNLMRSQLPGTEILDWVGPAKKHPAHKAQMQIETYKDYLIESERLMQTYPMLQGVGKGIGAEDAPKKSAFAWAWVGKGGGGVQASGTRVNVAYGLDDLAERVRGARATNWFHGEPKPGLTASMTSATHEFGHIFDAYSGGKLGDLAAKTLAKYKAEHPEMSQDDYSGYAKTNNMELVAETFENWHNNVEVTGVTNAIMMEIEEYIRIVSGDDDFRFIPNPGGGDGPTTTNEAGRAHSGESRGFSVTPAVGDPVRKRAAWEAPVGSKVRLRSTADNRVFTKEDDGLWRSEDGFLRPENAFFSDAKKKFYWEYVAYFEPAVEVDPVEGSKLKSLDDVQRAAPGSTVNLPGGGGYIKRADGQWVTQSSLDNPRAMAFSSNMLFDALKTATWGTFKKES